MIRSCRFEWNSIKLIVIGSTVDLYTRQNSILVIRHVGPCPPGFFKCTEDGYCFELYFRCNGVHDCPGGEDEAGCSPPPCVGLYRCRDSKICLPVWLLCNEDIYCPQGDDELYCDWRCPPGCTCYGQAYTCVRVFSTWEFPEMRYLDGSGSGLNMKQVSSNKALVHLCLARCELDDLGNVSLPNLRSLDLSDNHYHQVTVEQLKVFGNLRTLVLAGNPLSAPFWDMTDAAPLGLRDLDLSRVPLRVLHLGTHLPHLRWLSLSATGLEQVEGPGFQPLTSLREVDVRGCSLSSFPRRLFHGLRHLRHVQADTYRWCCQDALPDGECVRACVCVCVCVGRGGRCMCAWCLFACVCVREREREGGREREDKTYPTCRF